jgi:hypothetical protein
VLYTSLWRSAGLQNALKALPQCFIVLISVFRKLKQCQVLSICSTRNPKFFKVLRQCSCSAPQCCLVTVLLPLLLIFLFVTVVRNISQCSTVVRQCGASLLQFYKISPQSFTVPRSALTVLCPYHFARNC